MFCALKKGSIGRSFHDGRDSHKQQTGCFLTLDYRTIDKGGQANAILCSHQKGGISSTPHTPSLGHLPEHFRVPANLSI
jgi:hypothetical protein